MTTRVCVNAECKEPMLKNVLCSLSGMGVVPTIYKVKIDNGVINFHLKFDVADHNLPFVVCVFDTAGEDCIAVYDTVQTWCRNDDAPSPKVKNENFPKYRNGIFE